MMFLTVDGLWAGITVTGNRYANFSRWAPFPYIDETPPHVERIRMDSLNDTSSNPWTAFYIRVNIRKLLKFFPIQFLGSRIILSLF